MLFPSIPDADDLGHGVSFDTIEVDLPTFDNVAISDWLSAVAKTFDKTINTLTYVLCSDSYLLEMNIERLNHDTFTDIITFDLGDRSSGVIEGECYISIDRVEENAKHFGVPVVHELYRVFVHGLLHLCGLGDKSADEAIAMRKAEDSALQLLLG